MAKTELSPRYVRLGLLMRPLWPAFWYIGYVSRSTSKRRAR